MFECYCNRKSNFGASLVKTLKTSARILAVAVSAMQVSKVAVAAVDCSVEPRFPVVGWVKARVTLMHGYMESGSQSRSEEEVCVREISLSTFDVRGREEAAYYCLKSFPEELVVCNTALNNSPAEFVVVPAVWQRMVRNRTLIETRFHAYVQDKLKPQNWLDIFSRSLVAPPLSDEVILEGSIRAGGSSILADDYWVRLEIFGSKTVTSVR